MTPFLIIAGVIAFLFLWCVGGLAWEEHGYIKQAKVEHLKRVRK